MAEDNDDNKTEKILQLQLLIEQEKTKQKEIDIVIQQEKTKQIVEIERIKRLKVQYGQSLSSGNIELSSLRNYQDYYDHAVKGNINPLDINSLLNSNSYFDDDDYFDNHIAPLIKAYLNDPSLNLPIPEADIQERFGNLIIQFLMILDDRTSLKYLTTCNTTIEGRRFDSSFIYKNINININIRKQFRCLGDFIVCIGEYKSSEDSIANTKHIGQVCQYFDSILKLQRRQKIYGFLTNFVYIKFFYVEKKKDSSLFHYYQSYDLEMFNYWSQTSPVVPSMTTAEQANYRYLNKDTWKLFTKFLTMNTDFYEYEALYINPRDYLFANKYNIRKKLGNGATSMVYLLVKNEDNLLINDLHQCVIKICKDDESANLFINEVKIIEKLRQLNISNQFDKFFENILDSSRTGKYLLFTNELESIKSLTLIQSQQLIDIVQYLYDCCIIHRDLRPPNLMFDRRRQHLKLIDFGFAKTYEINDLALELPIEGTISYASENFFRFHLELSENLFFKQDYEYERTFDLQCAINIIMIMKHTYIRDKIDSIKTLLSVHEKILASSKLWENVKEENKNYFKLLELINNLTKSSDFDVIKQDVKHLYED
ncbi:unnamed protein product [Rotaria sordida]|uniref:Protein kinase domain-containing protein n=1 Tax=Rotaria sordida TaxID=392033 RepID=A0A814Y2D9_9BILA|nr:unnamed protein product [Rotaria sordida]